MLRLQGFLNAYIIKLKEADKFLKTQKGKELAHDVFVQSSNYTALDISRNTAKVAWNGYKFVNLGQKIKDFRFMQKVVTFINADFYAIQGLAKGASRPGLQIPVIGKTLVAAGTRTAAAVTVIFSVVGLAFGIWDVVEGADKIKNGSDMAKEFDKVARELTSRVANLSALDEEIQA